MLPRQSVPATSLPQPRNLSPLRLTGVGLFSSAKRQSRVGRHRPCRGLGGKKKCSSHSRVPAPFTVLTTIANQMVSDVTLFFLMVWSSCARPNQLLPLHRQFLLKPGPASDHWCVLLNPTQESEASKTIKYDRHHRRCSGLRVVGEAVPTVPRPRPPVLGRFLTSSCCADSGNSRQRVLLSRSLRDLTTDLSL